MRPEDLLFADDALGSTATATKEPVRVRWLGTAGFALSYDGTTVLFDPYLTRASLAACLSGPLATDVAAVHRFAPEADAIVVGHTHFDHALDVPTIARITGATVFGSRSATTLCRAAGLPEGRVRDVERAPGQEPVVAEVGPFTLRFIPSSHSKLLAGRVPLPGEIEDCDDIPLRADRFRCGAVFGVAIEVAGRRIYHMGSAELVEASAPPREVDLLLLCVAGWTSTPKLPERAIRQHAPRAVLLSHWDNFLLPFDRGARMLPAMQLPRLVDRLGRASRDVRIGTLGLNDAIAL